MIPPRWSSDAVPEVWLSPRLNTMTGLLSTLSRMVLDGFCEARLLVVFQGEDDHRVPRSGLRAIWGRLCEG